MIFGYVLIKRLKWIRGGGGGGAIHMYSLLQNCFEYHQWRSYMAHFTIHDEVSTNSIFYYKEIVHSISDTNNQF